MMITYPQSTLAANISRLKNVKMLFCEVIFGTPGKRCEGSGLCRIYTVTGAKRLVPNPRRLPVILSVDMQSRLHLRLRQSELTELLQQEVFCGESFLLEESFMLPRYYARKLETDQVSIPAGAYPLRKKGLWIDIDFYK